MVQKKETLVKDDEFPKSDSSKEGLSKLRPCFKSSEGTVTAGNASGINDGAALIMLCNRSEANTRNLKPLVRIVAWSQHGCEPMLMGIAPIEAIQKAVAKANWTLNDIDVFEINEAFASQSVAILKALKLDENKVCPG